MSSPPDVAGALMDALAPGSRIGVAVHDEDLRLLLISPSLADLSGTPAEEQLGRRLPEALPTEVGELAEASIREVAATGEPLLNLEPAVTAGHDRGWLVSIYPLPYADRRLVGVIALDVTESRRADERLRRSRERLASAQRMAGLGSWSWDVESDLWTWSDELFEVAGLPPGRAPNLRELLAAVPGVDRAGVRRVTADVVERGVSAAMRIPIVRPDGSRRTLYASGVPQRDESGRVVRVDGFAQDVTELVRAQTQQEAVAALGRLALSGLPIDALMRRAVDVVAEELQLDWVVVAEARGDEFVLRAVNGGEEPLIDGREIVLGEDTLLSLSLRQGRSIVVSDWDDEPPRPPSALMAQYGVRSSAAVVIGPPELPVGVLSGHSLQPNRVADPDVAFMTAVANIVASATERLRSEEQVAAHSAARGRLVAHALDAEDRTRRGISEALHDGPLQDLLALGHEMSRLRPAAEGDEQHLERAGASLARAVEQIRDVMLDLHPVVMQVGGLESALRAICSQHTRVDGYVCDVKIDPAATGARDELVLAIARELLRNVAKHAQARVARVRVTRVAEGVMLEVTDDGVGFGPPRLEEALRQGHIGVASSRERAEAIGGRLRVGPRTDGARGTQAVALLPVS